MMTGIPQQTLYHRSLGWHAPALRRTIIVAAIGLIVALVLLRFVTWELAGVGGWDAAACTFLMAIWPIIIRADRSVNPVSHRSIGTCQPFRGG